MAGEWYVSGNPLNALGATIGRSPTGQLLPSVAAGIQGQSNDATAAALEGYFAEERRRWDQDYSQKQGEIEQKYKIAKLTARTAEQANEVDAWYKRESAAVARERLALDRDQFDRELAFKQEQFGKEFGQRQYEFDTTTGLNRAKLGYDVLGMGAQLRGPSDYFQASNFMRGVAAQPETPTFLQALRDNTRLADYGMQGGVPQPETVGTLMNKLGSGGNQAQDNNYLASIGNVAAKGAHQLGPGSLEQLYDTERKLFASGLDALGYDTPSFLEQYRRSRVNQGLGSRGAA